MIEIFESEISSGAVKVPPIKRKNIKNQKKIQQTNRYFIIIY
jgi:hypothetical protein